MKGKMKKILLAVGLCLMVGLQSVGAAQAAIYSEACPFCGTRVTREDGERMVNLDFAAECGLHGNCAFYIATYEKYRKSTCQTPDCINYGRYTVLSTYGDIVHVILQ